jgi:mannosyl-3-phosphoglycerate phosphatase family protein
MKQLIVFSDLDGTLLDPFTYSFEAAQEALALLAERRIPLVICSSKTRVEIEQYRALMQNHDPFVSENGGGVFVPIYDDTGLADAFVEKGAERVGDYLILRLGSPYGRLREGMASLREQGFDVKGFGDMTIEEVSSLTGMSCSEAAMAKERDFDEPFLFGAADAERGALLSSIKEIGLKAIEGGRFYHLLGDNDKGKAVSLLINIYRDHFGDILTLGLGDSLNDLSMLRNIDIPVVVQRSDGTYDPSLILYNSIRANGVGPEGWNNAVKMIIQQNA